MPMNEEATKAARELVANASYLEHLTRQTILQRAMLLARAYLKLSGGSAGKVPPSTAGWLPMAEALRKALDEDLQKAAGRERAGGNGITAYALERARLMLAERYAALTPPAPSQEGASEGEGSPALRAGLCNSSSANSDTSPTRPPDVLEIARNMVQSPDNWPPMRVKQVAEALLASAKIAERVRDDPRRTHDDSWREAAGKIVGLIQGGLSHG